MGEWSDYFEFFPEENPANWIGGEFNPQNAVEFRAREAQAAEQLEKGCREMREEIQAIIDRHRPKGNADESHLPTEQRLSI